MEAELEAAYLLTLRAAWMADNKKPNSHGSLDGQGQGGPRRQRRSRCAAWSCVARVGYGEGELLEKWARDSKILDIFEGTQQIQMLVIARRLLDLSSAQLR